MRSHEFLTGIQTPWLFEDLSPQALETLVMHRNRWVESYVSDVVKAASRRYLQPTHRLVYFEQCLVGLVANYMLHVMRQNMAAYLIDLDQPAKFMCERANDRKEIVYLGSPLADCVGAGDATQPDQFVNMPNLLEKKAPPVSEGPIGLVVSRYSSAASARLGSFSERTVARWSNDIEICLYGDESPRTWIPPAGALADRLDYAETTFRLGPRPSILAYILSSNIGSIGCRARIDEMIIERWVSRDYEDYAHERVPEEDKLVLYPRTDIKGHEPIIFDGAIRDPGLLHSFFPGYYNIPELRIDILRNVIVSGVGVIFTETGEVLSGMMPVGGAAHQFFHPAVELDLVPDGDGYRCPKLHNTRAELKTAAMFGRMGFGNYHHLLMDVLPRLHLLRTPEAAAFLARSGLPSPPLLVNAEFDGWMNEKLAKCGTDPSNLVRMPKDGSVFVEMLFVPHLLNDFASWVSPLTHDFYRGVMAGLDLNTRDFGEKIFVLRREFHSDRRKISNDVEISDLLISQGFREVFPEHMTWEEEMAAFSKARLIVSAMGSNLSNMIFCQPGAKVLVLQSNESLFSLHSAMGAVGSNRTGFLWGESFSHPSRGEQVEFSIDSALMKRALEALYAA